MERLTKKLNKDYYVAGGAVLRQEGDSFGGEAINRLAGFENMYEDLVLKQGEIAKELEKLRLEDKTHSVKFKQLLGNKLLNNEILILLKQYGIE